jgi:hypothetical protein
MGIIANGANVPQDSREVPILGDRIGRANVRKATHAKHAIALPANRPIGEKVDEMPENQRNV